MSNTGTEALAKSPADGYAILLTASTHVINPHLLALPYHTIKDFAPVATLVSTGRILVLHPSVPANNLQELIAIGGQIQVYFGPPAGAIPHIKTGKVKAMAVSGETRSSGLPQVPTFTQAGLPGYDAKNWSGVLAPAGTPKGIVDKLSTEIARMLAMPNIKEKMVSLGLAPFISSPERFAALIKGDTAKFARIIKEANIKFEN